jgi:beta-galactosidase
MNEADFRATCAGVSLSLLLSLTLLGVIQRPAIGQTLPNIVPDGQPHKFELRDKHFLLDGQPTQLIAGEMHFGRVLPEDWELRIQQAKAMGLNTISFYLFWNQVEKQEGLFDFTGMNDVRRVLKLCQDNGMWAILRPGPYCCAEVEYGGIPWWTLKYPDVKIRTTDPRWLAWSARYIGEVYKQVADLQVTHGGPLLMVQFDNEYGIVARESADPNFAYLKAMHGVFTDAGFDVPLFSCDPGSTGEWTNPNARIPGLLIGRNGLGNNPARDQAATEAANGDNPVYAPEIYTGWFSGWGQSIQHRFSTAQLLSRLNFILDQHDSFCLYMFFGGTNWDYNTGCNTYLPVQTSYDYDAPVDEAGRVTAKYHALRDLFIKRLGVHPPAIPADQAVAVLPDIQLDQHESLLEWLADSPTTTSSKPLSMEDLNQAYGFVLYRKKFPDGIKGKLELKEAMDYTIVLVNGKPIGECFRGLGAGSNVMDVNESGPVTLDLLVHDLGRISVPVSLQTQRLARKGLIGGAFLDGTELTDWDIYSLPLDRVDGFKASDAPVTGPAFYQGSFNVDEPAGTFLDMRNWSFGVVWVNGHNLGRYWDRGGLRTLFVSSHFLRRGANEITILELHEAPRPAVVSSSDQIIETPPVGFTVRLDRAPAAPAAQTRAAP